MNTNTDRLIVLGGLWLSLLLVLAGCGSAITSPAPTATPSPTAAASPSLSPTPTPTPTPMPYPALTVTVGCSSNASESLEITGQPAPNLGIQIASKADFSDAQQRPLSLDPKTFTYAQSIPATPYPDGVYVRWVGDPSVTAHGISPGACSALKPSGRGVSEDELAAACAHGTAIAEVASYAASVHPHPLALVWNGGSGWSYEGYAIGGVWNAHSTDPWPSPVQLVACEDAKTAVKAGSCGTWQSTDGMVGEVIRYEYAVTVRVVVGRTGKTLTSKTFYGSVVACDSSWHTDDVNPPWRIYGSDPNSDSVSSYEGALSK